MTKEELKRWFFNNYNNCYLVKHKKSPKSLFMFYDPTFVRYKKLCRITGEKLVYPSKINGVCLFEQDYDNGTLWMNDNIIEFFYENYEFGWYNVSELIDGWLKESGNTLTPGTNSWIFDYYVKQTKKLSIYENL